MTNYDTIELTGALHCNTSTIKSNTDTYHIEHNMNSNTTHM